MKKTVLAITALAVALAASCGGKGDTPKTPAAGVADTTADATAVTTAVTTAENGGDSGEAKTPYEATWMKLATVGDNYVVYSYLDWDEEDEKYRTPTIIRVRGNQLTSRYFHEEDYIYKFDNQVEKKDNGVYLFRMTEGKGASDTSFHKYDKNEHELYSFQWVDKGKHIANWIQYYSYGKIQDSSLYIDSLYNTFPIVNYVWGQEEAEWTCENLAADITAVAPDTSLNHNSIGMAFVKGGAFTMGCLPERDGECESGEEPAKVTVGDFYISKYEVTQGLWKSVMGSYRKADTIADDLPVGRIGWYDGIGFVDLRAFICKLNAKTGKKYRLPTSAEWEFAARGGNSSKGYKYSGGNNINDVAWYGYDYCLRCSGNGNSGDKVHPVGTKAPNELGLYDMSGNVEEWTSDATHAGCLGMAHIVRGGGYWNDTLKNRISYNYYGTSANIGDNMGFRLAHDAGDFKR